jgi:hypothetical protein
VPSMRHSTHRPHREHAILKHALRHHHDKGSGLSMSSGDVAEVETRFDNATGEYVAVLQNPDGSEQIQRFKNALSFRRYLVDTERRLEAERWRKRAGGPEFLSEGWPGPISGES